MVFCEVPDKYHGIYVFQEQKNFCSKGSKELCPCIYFSVGQLINHLQNKSFVYIIYVRELCILLCIYKGTQIQYIIRKYVHVYLYSYNLYYKYILYYIIKYIHYKYTLNTLCTQNVYFGGD